MKTVKEWLEKQTAKLAFKMLCCHSCDGGYTCINPDHMFLGTLLDNAVDSSLKGRGRTGLPLDKAIVRANLLGMILRMSESEKRATLDAMEKMIEET